MLAQDVPVTPVPDLGGLSQALQTHQWPVLAGLVILVLIYIAKLPAMGSQWDRIPFKYRPLVVLSMGVGSGVAEALSTKQPWILALFRGLISGMGAMTADQVQSKIRTKQEGGA